MLFVQPEVSGKPFWVYLKFYLPTLHRSRRFIFIPQMFSCITRKKTKNTSPFTIHFSKQPLVRWNKNKANDLNVNIFCVATIDVEFPFCRHIFPYRLNFSHRTCNVSIKKISLHNKTVAYLGRVCEYLHKFKYFQTGNYF